MGTVTTERIDLPDNEWAELRNPKKVPERLRRPVREAAINLQRSLPEDQRRATVTVSDEPAEVAEPETQSAFGAPPLADLLGEDEADVAAAPYLPTSEQQTFVDLYNEVLLLSMITQWSYGEVTLEELQDLPGDAYDELLESVRALAKNADEGSESLTDPSSAPSAS